MTIFHKPLSPAAKAARKLFYALNDAALSAALADARQPTREEVLRSLTALADTPFNIKSYDQV
jgi:hypothetical protein